MSAWCDSLALVKTKVSSCATARAISGSGYHESARRARIGDWITHEVYPREPIQGCQRGCRRSLQAGATTVIADFKGLRDLTARPSSLVLVEVRVLCASVRCAY